LVLDFRYPILDLNPDLEPETEARSPDSSGNPFWITRSAAKRNLQQSAAELQKDCNG